MTTIVKCARGRITTRHGEDIGRDQFTGAKGHVGIDIGHGDSTTEDLKIVAPAAGRVTAVGTYGSYGLRIVITHDDGTWSLIAHLAAALVKVGDRVAQRQHIGTMGNSGTVYVHAHQEYHLANGAAVDPLAYMSTTAGGPGTPIGEEDMPLNADIDYPAFSAMLQRALTFDARPNGAGADWKLGPTIWERLNTIERAVVATAKPDIDEAELAKALAPLLDFSALSDTDLDRIAARVADVQSARLAK